MADNKTSKNAVILQPAKPKKGRRASAVLKPAVRATPKVAPIQKLASTARLTSKQRAVSQTLPSDQKLALREREAARIYATGIEQHKNNNLNAAIESYGKSLILNPKTPEVYNNMGAALRGTGKLEAAVACYRFCLNIRPNHPGVYSNIGNAYRELGSLQLSIESHQRAVELAPNDASTHYNLGLALRDFGHTEQSLSAFETALRLDPNHVECRWDRSLTLLALGDYARGFEEFEWRWKLARTPKRALTTPEWDGAKLKGKTVLIYQEQGIGDMIQFARYIPLVKEQGVNVVVECQPELASLMSTVPGIDKVINVGSALPKYDCHIAMMSLARVFKTTLETLPNKTPYMGPPEGVSIQLPTSMDHQRQIGIAWARRPTHTNDINRSCDFKYFIELLGVPGVSVYSLQKGLYEADIKENGCSALVIEMGSKLNDFADTTALIQQLDLVITVDTAVAHLAGAMGKSVWVVLPFAADWRWMVETSESPWYPSMRLFRQRKPGNWKQVFIDIREALCEDLNLSELKPISL